MNKIVVHFAGGRILKGVTSDFAATKTSFHLTSKDDHNKTDMINLHGLKAVFFVKDFEGDPEHTYMHECDDSQRVFGTKFRVHFKDGEEFVGVAMGYHKDKPGFFMTPCDLNCNTIRAFVINEFIARIERI